MPKMQHKILTMAMLCLKLVKLRVKVKEVNNLQSMFLRLLFILFKHY